MQSSASSTPASNKIPRKGILKKKSFESAQELLDDAKKMHWDEMNIMATYHPLDKDYGHMKIDESKTPYNHGYQSDSNDDKHKLDPNLLETKLNQLPKLFQQQQQQQQHQHDRQKHFNARHSNVSISEDDDSGDDETKERNEEFEKHRKDHYNEFKMAQLLKNSLQDDDDDDDDNDHNNVNMMI